MSKINNYFAKAALWNVYFVSSTVLSLIFYGFVMLMAGDQVIPHRPHWQISVALTVGYMIGLMLVMMVWMMRASDKFWQAAKALEGKIKEANTKEDLKALYNGDFQALRKMAGGTPHYSELNRLYAILDTKHSLI
jgi:type VI protein secretion system component VasK